VRREIVRYVVGFSVGKFGLPDKGRANGISTLTTNCRECRVFLAGETAREIATGRLANRTVRLSRTVSCGEIALLIARDRT